MLCFIFRGFRERTGLSKNDELHGFLSYSKMGDTIPAITQLHLRGVHFDRAILEKDVITNETNAALFSFKTHRDLSVSTRKEEHRAARRQENRTPCTTPLSMCCRKQ